MAKNVILTIAIFLSSNSFAKYASVSTVQGNLLLVFDKHESLLLEYPHESFERKVFFELLSHFPSFTQISSQLLSVFSNNQTIHALLLQREEDTFKSIPSLLESNGKVPVLHTQATPLHLQSEYSMSN